MYPTLLNVLVRNSIQVSVCFSSSSICSEKALLQNIGPGLEIQQSKAFLKKNQGTYINLSRLSYTQ